MSDHTMLFEIDTELYKIDNVISRVGTHDDIIRFENQDKAKIRLKEIILGDLKLLFPTLQIVETLRADGLNKIQFIYNILGRDEILVEYEYSKYEFLINRIANNGLYLLVETITQNMRIKCKRFAEDIFK